MKRRSLIRNAVLGLAISPFKSVLSAGSVQPYLSAPKKPVTIYNNWSAYDELSDAVQLTEELAMKELGEVVRLKAAGAQFDYYMMDAFWFDKSGGYRIWQKERWPNGPDKWIDACKENNIIPGLWFSVNNLIDSDNGNFLDPVPEWQDSVSTDPNSLCLFRGGYLKHFSDTLNMYAEKGVHMFKFDFANFGAATIDAEKVYVQSEIEEMNKRAFIDVLKQLRYKHPDIMLIAYNGFGGEMKSTFTPFRKSVEHRWLEVMDTLYCGDPRFADVPAMNIWRSMDIYSDHMVRQYELNGIPLHRIDNCGFMVGTTGTCYKRAGNGWKGMQILELARGGWVNVFHGNLELLGDEDAHWFAKTQKMYMEIQKFGTFQTFGNMPGNGKGYGFMASDGKGRICTVVNPSQAFAEIKLPVTNSSIGAVIYTDGGFTPVLKGNVLAVGPEQLVVVGFDEYAHEKYNLGSDETINIPVASELVKVNFTNTGKNRIRGTFIPLRNKSIRIFFQQIGGDGVPYRTRGGSPPKGKRMDTIFTISARQGKKTVPVKIQYDKIIWSGLSWAAGEISDTSINVGLPMEIECISTETEQLTLKADVYAVSYQS